MLTAIIVAAGSSRRVGFDKLFEIIAGKPVIVHAIGAFENSKSVSDIVVIAREDRRGEIRKLVRNQNWKKVRAIESGGEHRQKLPVDDARNEVRRFPDRRRGSMDRLGGRGPALIAIPEQFWNRVRIGDAQQIAIRIVAVLRDPCRRCLRVGDGQEAAQCIVASGCDLGRLISYG